MQEIIDLDFLSNEIVEYIFKNNFFDIIKIKNNTYYSIYIHEINQNNINIIRNILLDYYNSCVDLIPDGIHDKLDDDSDIYEVIDSIKILNLVSFKI